MVKLIYHGPGVRAFGVWMNDGDTGEYKDSAADALLRHPEFQVAPAEQTAEPIAEAEPVVVPEAAKAKRIGKRAGKAKAK